MLRDLDEQYSQYEKNRLDAKAFVDAKNATKEKLSREWNEKVEVNRRKIKQTRDEAMSLQTKFGHNGQSLIDCLSQVKAFGLSLRTGTSAYSPIINILEGNYK